MLKELARGVVILAVGLFIGALQAAPTLVVNAGELTGARNVDVNGTLYNVEFVDGSCVALFSGCDAASDFPFPSLAQAAAASQALLDFVFIDGPAGSFDTVPAATRGCSPFHIDMCLVLTPTRVDGFGRVSNDMVENRVREFDDFRIGDAGLGRGHNTTPRADLVYAVWTSAVPEPHAWSYLAIGGFVLALAMLRQRRSADRTSKLLS